MAAVRIASIRRLDDEEYIAFLVGLKCYEINIDVLDGIVEGSRGLFNRYIAHETLELICRLEENILEHVGEVVQNSTLYA